MRFARLVLRLSAIPFLAIGVAFLIDPAGMGRWVGLDVQGPTATADVRAVYGGLQIACGVFLMGSARRSYWTRAGLAAQMLLFGGLAAARFASYAVSGAPSALGWALHAGELLGFALGCVAWRRAFRQTSVGPP